MRKRQGQNIYELFGKKCSSCNGTGHVENELNFEISNLQLKNTEVKPSKSNIKQEKIDEKEILNTKNLNKEDSTKKENENDELNTSNPKEKNILTVDLTNDEKIVFSHLGINPLIKLGKEYLTSNSFVNLKDNSKQIEKTLDKKTTTGKRLKKTSKSRELEEIAISIEENANYNDEATNKANENEELASSDQKDEIEPTDEINNARKKRRRSSASIE